ncbi:MAG: hypothetical protein MZV65_41485 [Chromatiales bacterium]|nr:hypothetical protein [Chromatiales bacterium]
MISELIGTFVRFQQGGFADLAEEWARFDRVAGRRVRLRLPNATRDRHRPGRGCDRRVAAGDAQTARSAAISAGEISLRVGTVILLADVGNSRIKWVSLRARASLRRRGQASHGEESWAGTGEPGCGRSAAPGAGADRQRGRPRGPRGVAGMGPANLGHRGRIRGLDRGGLRHPQCLRRTGTDGRGPLGGDDRARGALTRHGPVMWWIAARRSRSMRWRRMADISGGVIIPGMRLMREALYRETRQIPPETGEARSVRPEYPRLRLGWAAYAVAAAIDGDYCANDSGRRRPAPGC